MSRKQAITHALTYYDDENSGFFNDLESWVSVPTESQNPKRVSELYRYLEEKIRPAFKEIGYSCHIYDNPIAGCGPALLASRIENDDYLTVIGYGHGDVVLGQEGQWENNRDPWQLSFEGDKVYGRGTADNKSQHLTHIKALKAIIETRGSLGFNSKFIVEMGEENGSRGFREMVIANKRDFAADVCFSSDGPRTQIGRPHINLGTRGASNFDLVVDLRAGGHHSGNWGGLLSSASIILSHAIATLVDQNGKILVEGWRLPGVPDEERACLADIIRDSGDPFPEIDDNWGEPGLSRAEKVYSWNCFDVLAFTAGDPENPVNAVPPKARASCQLRYIVGTDSENILQHLRAHLDAHGFDRVQIDNPKESNSGRFEACRTPIDDPWAKWLKAAIERSYDGTCGVLPNSGGSNVTDILRYGLDVPFIWLPLSYAGCSQHAPNEHILKPLARQGMEIVTGIYWDLASKEHTYRKP